MRQLNAWYISSFLISLVVAIPIITVFTSFFEDTSNYFEILKQTFFLEYIFNSLNLLIGVLFLTFVLGVGSAYIVSFYQFPGLVLYRENLSEYASIFRSCACNGSNKVLTMKLLIATLLIYAHFLIAGDFAYPLIEGQRSNGIFQPKIYGMKNGLEVSTHPILFFVKPNIKVKKFIGEKHGFGIAGRVNIDYPTILLKILQRKKIGGMLADDPEVGEVPFMLFLSSEVLVTKILRKNSFTGKVGVSLCPGCKLDERHIIDLPIVYSRMAIYHSGFGSNLGVDYDFNPSEKIKIKTLFLTKNFVQCYNGLYRVKYNALRVIRPSSFSLANTSMEFSKKEEAHWHSLRQQWSYLFYGRTFPGVFVNDIVCPSVIFYVCTMSRGTHNCTTQNQALKFPCGFGCVWKLFLELVEFQSYKTCFLGVFDFVRF